MKMIAELKKRYGNKCTAIKLNYEGTCVNTPSIKMRFCEAVNYSFNIPLLLKSSCLSCMGSQRSFGLFKSDEELIAHISNESKASSQTIKKALQNIPVFEVPVRNIFLGIQHNMEDIILPDMFIIQIKPKDAMDLMKLYIVKTNTFPVLQPYPFLSVCGSVVVGVIKLKQMSVSFGCPESRKYGGVIDENVIVGIPYNICNQLFN